MEQAGYTLYPECMTEKDIQKFRKYYHRNRPTPVYQGGTPECSHGEELCTFNGDRLSRCRVWFAVKKDVYYIYRENFKNPQRQDAYGTSVLSIQFTKTEHPTLSIKNRYNHTVNNPDATFSNDLDNIIPGLTHAFATTFSLNLSDTNKRALALNGYRLGDDGKYYRQNCEKDNVVYCENNVIIDNGRVIKLSSDFMLLDNYIIDLKHKRIGTYDPTIGDARVDKKDAFIASIGEIKDIEIIKGKNKERTLSITPEHGVKAVDITFGKDNRILEVNDPNSTYIGDKYLSHSRSVRSFSAPRAVEIGDYCLYRSCGIRSIDVHRVEKVGKFFLSQSLVDSIDLPYLQEASDSCFKLGVFNSVNCPNLKKLGSYCFNDLVSKKSLPSELVKEIKNRGQQDAFFANPSQYVANIFRSNNIVDILMHAPEEGLQEIRLPRLETIGDRNFCRNNDLRRLYTPRLYTIGEKNFTGNSPSLVVVHAFGTIHETKENPSTATTEERILLEACKAEIDALQDRLLGKEATNNTNVAENTSENENVTENTDNNENMTENTATSETTQDNPTNNGSVAGGTAVTDSVSQTATDINGAIDIDHQHTDRQTAMRDHTSTASHSDREM